MRAIEAICEATLQKYFLEGIKARWRATTNDRLTWQAAFEEGMTVSTPKLFSWFDIPRLGAYFQSQRITPKVSLHYANGRLLFKIIEPLSTQVVSVPYLLRNLAGSLPYL